MEQESRTLLVGLKKCLQALHRGKWYKFFVLSSAVRAQNIRAAARQEKKMAFGVQVDDLISQIKARARCVRQRPPDASIWVIPVWRSVWPGLSSVCVHKPASFSSDRLCLPGGTGWFCFSSEIWMQSRQPSGCIARCVFPAGGVVRKNRREAKGRFPVRHRAISGLTGEETAGVADG